MMHSLKRIFVLSIAVLVNTLGHAQSQPHPTLVLIHGALLTSQVWAPVQSYLQDRNINVLTIDTPGRLNDGVAAEDATLSAAVAKVCQVVNLQPEPVILVGHNQAGAIITQATELCGQRIKGLVYLAAVIPWPGEKPFDILSQLDNYNFDLIAPLDVNTGLSQPDINAPIKSLFMADASESQADLTILNMVPEPIVFAFEPLNYSMTYFSTIAKYYIKTTQDRMISPASQDKFINRQLLKRVILIDSGHAPFISQPSVVANILADITKELS